MSLHVEIVIVLVVMDELYVDFSFTVGERAEIPVLALLNVVGVVCTEFNLVFVCPV